MPANPMKKANFACPGAARIVGIVLVVVLVWPLDLAGAAASPAARAGTEQAPSRSTALTGPLDSGKVRATRPARAGGDKSRKGARQPRRPATVAVPSPKLTTPAASESGNPPPQAGAKAPLQEAPQAKSNAPTDAELAAIARQYCTNNAAAAAEARLRARHAELRELEGQLDRKSEALEKMVEEARLWVEKREKIWAGARENLIEAYSKMRPEAAAQQIAAMSEDAAASILMKLNARAASAILNEMGADRAARLADQALKRSGARGVQEKNGS